MCIYFSNIDDNGNKLFDIRGWGYLTGKGSEALGMDEDKAAEIQDNIGKHIVELMNKSN